MSATRLKVRAVVHRVTTMLAAAREPASAEAWVDLSAGGAHELSLRLDQPPEPDRRLVQLFLLDGEGGLLDRSVQVLITNLDGDQLALGQVAPDGDGYRYELSASQVFRDLDMPASRAHGTSNVSMLRLALRDVPVRVSFRAEGLQADSVVLDPETAPDTVTVVFTP